MSEPFFTVAIPTKNRPDHLDNAIRSVLQQNFQDFEIIVSDNSDEAVSGRAAELVAAFEDERIRYVRASGQLSMPDNWENAIAEARGEFVGILTDRSVFRRDALDTVHAEIGKSGAKLVSWFMDHYGGDLYGNEYRPRKCTHRRYRYDKDTVLKYFLHGHPKFAPKIIPRLMTSMCHRSILEAIRASAVGRCCPPVCPDYTSGFLMMAHTDWLLVVDEALFVSCGRGNGSAFRRRDELAERFRQDLGMTWTDLVDRMPSDACFSHALVLNDFIRLRDMLPDQFAGLDIDRVQYYLGCLTDYVKTAAHGGDRTEDLDILIDSLNNESKDLQREVRARRLYLKSVFACPAGPLLSGGNEDVDYEDVSEDGAGTRYDTVFDALAGSAAARKPSPRNFLDLMPGLDAVPYRSRTRTKKGPRPPDLTHTRERVSRAAQPSFIPHNSDLTDATTGS